MTKRRRECMVLLAACAALLWAGTAQAGLTAAQKCEKSKNKAAGKYGQCIATQRGREIVGKVPDYAGCATKLSDSFTKAETNAAGACPTTGDEAQVQSRLDGVYKPDKALPKWLSGTRFVDNGDGTVTDTLTGLMWERKTDDSTVHDKDNRYTWSISFSDPDGTVFTDFLAELNDCESTDGTTITGGFAGHCDWRLPTSAELKGILLSAYPCGTNPCIDPAFGLTQSYYYWSATALAPGAGGTAWDVNFSDGNVSALTKTTAVESADYVRAVRGGL